MVSSHFRNLVNFYFSLTEIVLQSWFAPPEDIPVMIDRSNDHPPSPPRRDRSLAGRRKARADKAARERRIRQSPQRRRVGCRDRAVRGGYGPEYARDRPGNSGASRARAPGRVLGRPGQSSQRGLLVSYSAMGGGNLEAVDRVVKIVRELDRYHGFAGISQPARTEQGRLAAPAPIPLALAAPDRSPEGNGAASA
jgi:hypothetical protein